MTGKKSLRHGSSRKSGIGSYGTRPWEANYDHDQFLSAMTPVSFSEAEAVPEVEAGVGIAAKAESAPRRERFGGFAEEFLSKIKRPFSMAAGVPMEAAHA